MFKRSSESKLTNQWKQLSRVNPQLNEAKSRWRMIEADLYKAIMGARLSGLEYAVLLTIIHYTYGWRRTQTDLEIGQIAKDTESTRRGVQKAMNTLKARRIIIAERCGRIVRGEQLNRVMLNKYYDTWLTPARTAKESAEELSVEPTYEQPFTGEDSFIREQIGQSPANGSSHSIVNVSIGEEEGTTPPASNSSAFREWVEAHKVDVMQIAQRFNPVNPVEWIDGILNDILDKMEQDPDLGRKYICNKKWGVFLLNWFERL